MIEVEKNPVMGLLLAEDLSNSNNVEIANLQRALNIISNTAYSSSHVSNSRGGVISSSSLPHQAAWVLLLAKSLYTKG
jgi:hypothetical protein